MNIKQIAIISLFVLPVEGYSKNLTPEACETYKLSLDSINSASVTYKDEIWQEIGNRYKGCVVSAKIDVRKAGKNYKPYSYTYLLPGWKSGNYAVDENEYTTVQQIINNNKTCFIRHIWTYSPKRDNDKINLIIKCGIQVK